MLDVNEPCTDVAHPYFLEPIEVKQTISQTKGSDLPHRLKNGDKLHCLIKPSIA